MNNKLLQQIGRSHTYTSSILYHLFKGNRRIKILNRIKKLIEIKNETKY
jgi:hypothetical protein